jgi:ABC-2 type transport system permease protein
MRIVSIVRKLWREARRDLWVLLLSLAFAPLFVFLYWLITGGSGSTSYGVVIINQDKPAMMADGSTLSGGTDIATSIRELTYENGAPLLRVEFSDSRAQAEQLLRDRVASALIIIPPEFSTHLAAFQSGQDASNTEITSIGDLSNPTYSIAAVMAMTAIDRYTQNLTEATRPVELVEIPLGASAARTEFETYVPGLFVFSIIILIFQAAMTPARDIETGALQRLRLSRLTSFEYLGGTTLWLTAVALLEVMFTFGTALAFGFRSQGPLWLAILITAITSLSIIGSGLIVACFSKTVSQAFVIANFPLGFLMFLTGTVFPLPRTEIFSLFGHGITLYDLLPPTHAVIALNKIFTLGAKAGDVGFELASLTILSAINFGVGVWIFQRTQMRSA